jgi:hypothetical protein
LLLAQRYGSGSLVRTAQGIVPLRNFTPEQVRDHVKRLIDDVGQDGGYILATGAVVDDPRPETLHAFIDTGA